MPLRRDDDDGTGYWLEVQVRGESLPKPTPLWKATDSVAFGLLHSIILEVVVTYNIFEVINRLVHFMRDDQIVPKITRK